MGWNDHLDDYRLYYEDICPFCNKKFEYSVTLQQPGFRDKDTLYCPYCKKEIESSMEYEYHYERIKR